MTRADHITGCLLGCALGDALGLPLENLSAQRIGRLLGDAPLTHRFLPGRGMVSDDTEHTCMLGQALLEAGPEAAPLARALARRLRWWFWMLPAGVGLGTLRAMLKLTVGFSPERSGVFSAGNGPAMRAPVLGACLAGDREALLAACRATTRITHTDPRAEEGARIVALAARRGALGGPLDFGVLLPELLEAVPDGDLHEMLLRVQASLEAGETPAQFATAQGWGRGVTGFVVHTVPAALHCCLSHPDDPGAAIEASVRLGGDTDTVAAIVGGVAGAACGAGALSAELVAGLAEFPRDVAWMRELGARLAARFPLDGSAPGGALAPLPLRWWLIPPRNVLFLAIVLGHVFRRLLPPY